MNLPTKYAKRLKIILIILFIGTLCLSLFRDYNNLKKDYPCDLRKRIVGARYMAKGYSPYYFKWTAAYPAELCNQYEGDATFKQNIVTLPPGYTWLLQPLSTLQFTTIEKIWFIFQYLSLLVIFSLFYFKNANGTSKNLLLILYSLILLSKGWIMNIDIGQSYIIFPLLLSVMYVLFHKHPKSLFYYGLFIGLCIWLRPSFIFFILPFLFAEKKLLFFKGLFIMGGICLLQIFIFNQFNNWVDFFTSSANWMAYYSERNFDNGVHFGKLAVPSIIENQSNFNAHPYPSYIANLPIELRSLFKFYASSTVYSCIFVGVLLILTYLFFFKNKLKDTTLLLFSGFCFNYLSEIFLWVPKNDYYFVELFFPLCLLIYCEHKVDKRILISVFIGLFFSAYLVKIIPMQLLLGEYIIAGSLFLYLFINLKKSKVNN